MRATSVVDDNAWAEATVTAQAWGRSPSGPWGSVAAPWDHSLALRTDGTVWAWGTPPFIGV